MSVLNGLNLEKCKGLFSPGTKKKGVCIKRESLKKGLRLYCPACPANCSVELLVARMITGHRNDGRPFFD